ncbi:arrestin domain-containing protein 17-like isoform X1 [Pollicipes pollicipes]|uniref:arrestin domain-containing protein 17-like isoform X1 n=1 Tax=Pollicipes pollicipes TaxID=41117 RepID=UPI0018854C58|nr:arrestin domain-containing protein 17-like isoform X1 [Pollicipes pollicipes]
MSMTMAACGVTRICHDCEGWVQCSNDSAWSYFNMALNAGTASPEVIVSSPSSLILRKCHLPKHCRIPGASIAVEGVASTYWTTSSGDDTSSYSDEVWLISQKLTLIKDPGRDLMPGKHQLPFSFQLPSRLPPSLSASYGKVKYTFRARAVSSGLFSFNGKVDGRLTVAPHRDLNEHPRLGKPVTLESKTAWSLFGPSSKRFTLTMPKSGFAGGEAIEIWVDGPQSVLEAMASGDGRLKLKRRTVFRAGAFTQEKKQVLSVLKPGRVAASWRVLRLPVPSGEASVEEDVCRIITVSHYVKVCGEPGRSAQHWYRRQGRSRGLCRLVFSYTLTKIQCFSVLPVTAVRTDGAGVTRQQAFSW